MHDSFGIYVHVPFCAKRCWYCDFYTVARDGALPHREYLAALISQLDKDVMTFNLSQRELSTLFFGGGTPSLMPASFFDQLLEALSQHFSFSTDLEVTAEVNPATVGPDWFRDVRGAGVTRISMGVQSFNDRLLKRLGRNHTASEAIRAISEAKATGFKSVSCDLMFANPEESDADLESDIQTASLLKPDHISAYQLTLGEHKIRAQNAFVPEEVQLDQMRITSDLLERSGWKRYEISNFATPGHECRHNMLYWRYGNYLGLGTGASSFLKNPQHERKEESFGRRFTCIRNIDKYIGGSRAMEEEEVITLRTAMGEFCFLGLRTTEGISSAHFAELFGVELPSIFEAELQELISKRMMRATIEGYALTERGFELSNQIAAKFV